MKNALGNLMIIFALLCTGLSPAWALRCNNDLVGIGDHKLEVLQSCGEPVLIDRWEEYRKAHDNYYGHWYPKIETVIIEEWSYNFGPNKFMRIIRFENGYLKNIESVGYGF
jgi:hypothetical protein